MIQLHLFPDPIIVAAERAQRKDRAWIMRTRDELEEVEARIEQRQEDIDDYYAGRGMSEDLIQDGSQEIYAAERAKERQAAKGEDQATPRPHRRAESSPPKPSTEHLVYRTFNVANPTSARINEIIQNRITIWLSAQPRFSKWWWIGAIRKTRLPVNLK